MKASAFKLSLLLLLVTTVYFSCKPKGQKDLILGTWNMNEGRMKANGDSIKIEISFLDNGVTTYNSYVNGKLAASDSASYTFSNDSKYLVTKQKNPELIDSVKIIELTGKVLKVKSEHGMDTLTITLTKK